MVVPSTGKAFKLMPSAPNTTYNQENYPEAMFGLDLFENDLRTNLAALLFKDEEPGKEHLSHGLAGMHTQRIQSLPTGHGHLQDSLATERLA